MEIKGADERPLLLISQKDKQYFYDVADNRFRTTDLPELSNKDVLASAFGWLVLVDKSTFHCCLWNPVSLDKIELPDLSYPAPFDKCILSKPPTEPDCHILFISSTSKVQLFCQIGDDRFGMHDKGTRLSAVASFQWKIYGIVLGVRFLFVTVDFVGETLELNPILIEGRVPWDMPNPIRSWAYKSLIYLIKSSCGELLLVQKMLSTFQFSNGIEFRVFRVDVDRMECKELMNIGEQAIFVRSMGDAFCCSSFNIKSNSIYYTVPFSRNLFIYNLNDRSTTVLLPCSVATRSNSTSSWVPPQIFSKFLI